MATAAAAMTTTAVTAAKDDKVGSGEGVATANGSGGRGGHGGDKRHTECKGHGQR